MIFFFVHLDGTAALFRLVTRASAARERERERERALLGIFHSGGGGVQNFVTCGVQLY